ncbi:hypothetical protein HFP71_31960 [Streptomyces sp. ARC32]
MTIDSRERTASGRTSEARATAAPGSPAHAQLSARRRVSSSRAPRIWGGTWARERAVASTARLAAVRSPVATARSRRAPPIAESTRIAPSAPAIHGASRRSRRSRRANPRRARVM